MSIIALVLLAVYGWNLFQLYQRSTELRDLFEERYPLPELKT